MAARSSSSGAPKPRHLTIGYHKHDQRHDGRRVCTRTVPFLRMSGEWLEQAGFNVGARVRVHVDQGRLVIEPA
jgi:toxic protein SymE